jgi:hypothetical protein
MCEILLKYLPLSFLLLSFCAYAQNSSNIAGQYKISNEVLIINTDNTFLILGMGSIIKGTVETNESTVKLIPYKPEYPFALFGRYHAGLGNGSKMMFLNFDQAETLVNYDLDNDSVQKMERVFNENANCIEYPNVLSLPYQNKRFYFAIKDANQIYAFETVQEYNDFIVAYMPIKAPFSERILTRKKSEDELLFQGEVLKKSPTAMDPKIVAKLMGMYDRGNAEMDPYYCNPQYNYFEQNGVDLSEYERVQNGKELHYTYKDTELEEDKTDYSAIGIIYSYTKNHPIPLMNSSYKIESGSVFNFTCKE